MKPVLCFGEALVDFLAAPEADPETPRAYLRHAGGAPANVAVALARLGAPAAFVGMLGADMFGDFLLERLSAHGVDTRQIRRTEMAKTALAFVSLDARGERSFSFYRPPAADLLFRDEYFETRAFAGAGAFHACSNSLTEADIAQTTLAGLRLARAHGVLTSFDVNLRPALWPVDLDPSARVWSAIELADIVKFSAEEWRFLYRDERRERATRERIWRGATRLILITDGERGLSWYTPRAQGHCPAFAMRAVDTTAAGDAFVGGLLFQLGERGIDVDALPDFIDERAAFAESLRFAAACGALAVTRHGAFSAMPTRAEVQALLARTPTTIASARRTGTEPPS